MRGKEKVELVCPSCEKSFKVPQDVADRGRKYCSMECCAKYRHFGIGPYSKSKGKYLTNGK